MTWKLNATLQHIFQDYYSLNLYPKIYFQTSITYPCFRTFLRLIKFRYFRPKMDKDIRTWTRECTTCQQAKIHKHTKSKALLFEIPSQRFDTIYIDMWVPFFQIKFQDQNATAHFATSSNASIEQQNGSKQFPSLIYWQNL